MSSNSAAWQVAAKAKPFEIKPAPMWEPEGAEILVQNRALAINPIDANLQVNPRFPFDYPYIFGQDVAGEVVAVGPSVTRFKKGDRVVGHAVGFQTKRPQENGFQLYTILNSHMSSEIPANMSYENAAVLPLALSTAACGLFQPAPCLGLQLPTEPAQKPNRQTVLIWGGSSSVGSNAIQLAVAAGYRVVSTASPRNFDYVKGLGADQVFDYNNTTTISDIVEALKGKSVAGALDCIGGAACMSCVEILHKTAGTGVVTTTKGGCDNPPEGVSVKRLFGSTVKDNFVGPAIYQDFLPNALNKGSFVPSPPPQVVGAGLSSVQIGCNEMLKGVSASKLVVTL